MNDREKLIEVLTPVLGGTLFPGVIMGLADYLLANGVTVQRWIPVTERLPEECKDVLVYRITGCEVDSCVSRQKADWSYDLVSQYPVTHWMPLPEPPKNEKGE